MSGHKKTHGDEHEFDGDDPIAEGSLRPQIPTVHDNTKHTVDYLEESTFDIHDAYQSNRESAGRLWGGNILDDVGGTVFIVSGAGLIKTEGASLEDIPTGLNQGQGSTLQYVEWADASGFALAGEGYNLIYWDASASGFDVKLIEDFYDHFDFTSDFTVGRVYYDGANVIKRLCGMNIWNFDRRVQMFGEERFPVERVFGLMIGESGTRNITITSGVIWAEMVNRFTIFPTGTFDTSGTDTFEYWYRDGMGGWVRSNTHTQINNTQYDDGSGALKNLTSNRYGVHWVFVSHKSNVHVIFGQGDYTLNQANIAQLPAELPGLLDAYSTFVGKIIVRQGDASFTSVQSPFTVTLTQGVVNRHNGLSGLQGGTTDQYYHLTQAAYNNLSTQDQQVLTTSSPTFDGLTLTDPLDMSTNLINNVADPVSDQDAATRKWVEDNFNDYTLEDHDRNNHTDINQSLLTTDEVQFDKISLQNSLKHGDLSIYPVGAQASPENAHLSDYQIMLRNMGADTGYLGKIGFFASTNTTSATTPGAAITSQRTGGWSRGNIEFWVKTGTGQTSSLTKALEIDNNANILATQELTTGSLRSNDGFTMTSYHQIMPEDIGGTYLTSSLFGLHLIAKRPTHIGQCEVDAQTSGTLVVRLQKWEEGTGVYGNVLSERSISVVSGVNLINLDITVNESDDDYLLYKSSGPNLRRSTGIDFAHLDYPHLQIVQGGRSSDGATYTNYYHFFNMETSAPNILDSIHQDKDGDVEISADFTVVGETTTDDITVNDNLNIPVYATRTDIAAPAQGFLAFVADEGRLVFEDGT